MTTMQQETTREENSWAMVCHLAGLLGLVIPMIGNIVGPLIVWKMKGPESPFIDANGKAALNFNISLTLYFAILIFVGTLLSFIVIGVFVFMAMPFIAIAAVIVIAYAGFRASTGDLPKYPLAITFVK